jgi:hypothetical protein
MAPKGQHYATLTAEFLRHQYIELRKTAPQIAKEIGAGRHAVHNALVRHQIPRRSGWESRRPEWSKKRRGFKPCAKCRRDLPLKAFHKSQRERTGRTCYCRDCTAERMKRYAPRLVAQRRVRKARLVLAFGDECAVCHARSLPVDAYSFHHHGQSMRDADYVPPSEVISRKSEALLNKERAHWTMLCANCHQIHHGSRLTASQILANADD